MSDLKNTFGGHAGYSTAVRKQLRFIARALNREASSTVCQQPQGACDAVCEGHNGRSRRQAGAPGQESSYRQMHVGFEPAPDLGKRNGVISAVRKSGGCKIKFVVTNPRARIAIGLIYMQSISIGPPMKQKALRIDKNNHALCVAVVRTVNPHEDALARSECDLVHRLPGFPRIDAAHLDKSSTGFG